MLVEVKAGRCVDKGKCVAKAATLLHEEGANLDLQRHHINQVLSFHVIETSD